jgi:hypothetical protein
MIANNDLEESGRDTFKVIICHFHWGTEGNHGDPYVSIVGIPAEIQTGHLSSTSQRLAAWANFQEPFNVNSESSCNGIGEV